MAALSPSLFRFTAAAVVHPGAFTVLLLTVLWRVWRNRQQHRGERLAKQLFSKLGVAPKESEGIAHAILEDGRRFQIRLLVRPQGQELHLGVVSDVYMNKELIPRGLLLAMALENCRFRAPVFCLAPSRFGHGILLGRTCDLRVHGVDELVAACRELSQLLSKALLRWYAEGLIENGQSFAARSGHDQS